MTDDIESLLVEVRAGTGGFERDIGVMRGAIDGTLVTGFERAGQVLERGLIGAIRRGSLGFDDLKRVALSAMNCKSLALLSKSKSFNTKPRRT